MSGKRGEGKTRLPGFNSFQGVSKTGQLRHRLRIEPTGSISPQILAGDAGRDGSALPSGGHPLRGEKTLFLVKFKFTILWAEEKHGERKDERW
jgi:hypothetical protein